VKLHDGLNELGGLTPPRSPCEKQMTTEPVTQNVESTPVAPFGDEEMQDLDREDVQAGRVMAWLLCFFFLYTIVVTSIAAWWTWDAIRG